MSSSGQISGLRGQRVYGQHGQRHAPRGSDPGLTDIWRNVLTGGTPWDSGTTYDAGDIVLDVDGIFQYQAAAGSVYVSGTITPNQGISPGHTSGWQRFWNQYASVFQNGSNASPSTGIPNPVPLRYRLSVGPPNYYDDNGDLVYTQHQIEIQGDVTGLSIGDTVFVILPEYQHDYDVPYQTHDQAGNFVACRLLSTGEFVWFTH